jgi:hypothetical protein
VNKILVRRIELHSSSIRISSNNLLFFIPIYYILKIGEKNKGWQFGENLRTGRTGWFPLAYTEQIASTDESK